MPSMSSSELHLFVLEGVRTESIYVDKLEQHFLGKRISVKCVYEAEIYQLYKQLKAEDFAYDMVDLLKERNKANAALLHDYNSDSFASVYLFFDYDAHSSMADDGKLQEMLDYFDNETENGMNYLVNDVYDLPQQIESQSTIFKKQLEKHITHKCPEVAVLSAFPIYALDYYGVEGLKRKLEESYEN